MKKLIIGLFAMFMSLSSFADTRDQYEFLYSGFESIKNAQLRTEVTRTEYRSVQDWCQQRVCRPTNCRRVCSPGPRPTCRQVCDGPQNCHWRQVRCVRRVPVQVFDHFVENMITMYFSGNQNGVSEYFKLVQEGDSFRLNVDSSKRNAIILENQVISKSRSRNVENVKTDLYVHLMDLSAIEAMKNLGIQNVELNGNILSFDIPNSSEPFETNLKILRRRIGADYILFNRKLGPNDYKSEQLGTHQKVTVDLDHIGVQRPSKMTVNIKHGFIPAENQVILNEREIGDTYAQRIIAY